MISYKNKFFPVVFTFDTYAILILVNLIKNLKNCRIYFRIQLFKDVIYWKIVYSVLGCSG